MIIYRIPVFSENKWQKGAHNKWQSSLSRML